MTLWIAESPFRASSVLPVVTRCKFKKNVFSNFFVFQYFSFLFGMVIEALLIMLTI